MDAAAAGARGWVPFMQRQCSTPAVHRVHALETGYLLGTCCVAGRVALAGRSHIALNIAVALRHPPPTPIEQPSLPLAVRLQPFPGVVDALHSSPFPVYFATSKAAHRVSALMKAVMGMDVPQDSPRLFASLLP